MDEPFSSPVGSADEQVWITSGPEITVSQLFAFKPDPDHHLVPRSGERHFGLFGNVDWFGIGESPLEHSCVMCFLYAYSYETSLEN